MPWIHHPQGAYYIPPRSGDADDFIDQMAHDGYRGPTAVGVRYLESFDPLFGGAFSSIDPDTFRPLTPFERRAMEAAMDLWSDVANIRFDGTEDEIEFAAATFDAGGRYTPTGFGFDRGVWVSTANTVSGTEFVDDWAFGTFVHEVGHAIGIGHPGNYNGTATYADDAIFIEDTRANTVIDGGDGWDTIVYGGDLEVRGVEKDGDDYLVHTDDGTDTLVEMEAISIDGGPVISLWWASIAHTVRSYDTDAAPAVDTGSLFEGWFLW